MRHSPGSQSVVERLTLNGESSSGPHCVEAHCRSGERCRRRRSSGHPGRYRPGDSPRRDTLHCRSSKNTGLSAIETHLESTIARWWASQPAIATRFHRKSTVGFRTAEAHLDVGPRDTPDLSPSRLGRTSHFLDKSSSRPASAWRGIHLSSLTWGSIGLLETRSSFLWKFLGDIPR